MVNYYALHFSVKKVSLTFLGAQQYITYIGVKWLMSLTDPEKVRETGTNKLIERDTKKFWTL
jgi:hypothetical protein